MPTRRILLASLALAPFVRPALAAPTRKFVLEEFRAAQAADKSILVEISASWCPVCRKQKPILAKLLAEPRFREMVSFDVDFDAQKDIVRLMETRMQSTLIVFRGQDEMGRTMGDTNPQSIEALLAMAA
jgi:thiol-disulfide isomerase/thioredoxin